MSKNRWLIEKFRLNDDDVFEELRSEQTVLKLDNLEPSSHYNLEIYAIIDENTQTDKQEIACNTAPSLTTISIALDDGSESTDIVIMWPHQSVFHGFAIDSEPPIAYIEKVKKEVREFVVEGVLTSVKIQGLHPGTSYNITFQGRDRMFPGRRAIYSII